MLADLLAIPSVGLNELAIESGVAEKTKDGLLVDTGALRRSLLRRNEGRCLVYGHFLPDVLRRNEVEVVVVLRCNPLELKRRLLARGYGGRRLRDNLESELIGVTLSYAIERFGEGSVIEFDTTNTARSSAARALASIIRGRPRASSRIDWTLDYTSAEKLRSLLSENRTGLART